MRCRGSAASFNQIKRGVNGIVTLLEGSAGERAAALSQATVAVVIPAFNEVVTLREVVIRTLRQTDRIIVVDDGSDDGTAATLHDLPVTVLRNTENLGKAASLRRGMVHALGDGASAVVTIDADGQHEPEDIPRLIAAHVANPRSIIVGARLHERDNIPRARYLANRCANFLISWAAGYAIADSQSGFRLYPAAVLSALDIGNERSRGFAFETSMLIKAARIDVMSVPVRISAIYRIGARASHFRPVVDIFFIGLVIWGSILSRGFNIPGLVRSRRGANRSQPSHSA
jgi:glycosyltransferase involved in cell wall biosynthesis